MSLRVCPYLFLLVIFNTASFAQYNREIASPESLDIKTTIRGRIISGSAVTLDNLFTEIDSIDHSGRSQKTPVSSNGFFEFSGVPGTTYLVRVTNLAGNILVEKAVTPTPAGSVEIQLPGRETERPAQGTISLFELEHKVPSKALKEGREADRSYGKHDMKSYIVHAEKAVALDPDWVVARRNLGIAYMTMGENDKAAHEFEEALKRDPHSTAVYAALSCVYLQLNRFPAAEMAARRAVDIDPSFEPSHYYLGVSLVLQHKDDSEALQHLQRISGRYPKAHLAEAHILEHLGMKQAAKGQLEDYLASGETASRSVVKTWLSSLK